MPEKMKAQVFYKPEVMQLESVDIPEIADNEVLIKVKAVGICGSDISYYYGHSPLETSDGLGPLILGHEFSGEVAKIGAIPASLKLFNIGDRVVINPVQQCNACDMCLQGHFNLCPNVSTSGVSTNGAFADYCKVSYTHVYKLPDSTTFEQAALMEPLACATFGVSKADIGIGDFVVIFGPGSIGMMMIQLAKAMGAGKIALVGIIDYSLDVGKKAGADYVFNTLDKDSPDYVADLTAKIRELTDGKMADRVLVPTSAISALQQALDVSGKASTIVYFGLPGPDDKIQIPALATIQAEKTIKFSWLAPLVWPDAMKSVEHGFVDMSSIITHRYSLEDLEKGIHFMKNSTEDKIKGVVIMD